MKVGHGRGEKCTRHVGTTLDRILKKAEGVGGGGVELINVGQKTASRGCWCTASEQDRQEKRQRTEQANTGHCQQLTAQGHCKQLTAHSVK